MSSLSEKYIQDKILEIIEKDTAYNELNENILRIEREIKKELNSNLTKKYNELEELVIRSITHIIFSACKSIVGNPTPYLHPIDNYKNTFIKDYLDSGQNAV